MSDLISRGAAIKAYARKREEWYGNGPLPSMESLMWQWAISIAEGLPAVDAAPVVHARWVKMTGMMPPEYHGHYMCSNCEWHMKGLRNSWTREEELSYCPGCGAIMDGGESDESK